MRRPPVSIATLVVCLACGLAASACTPAHLGLGGDDGVDAFCGDGRVTGDELCDDGNSAGGDGCSEECQPEIPPNCGDGILQADEGEFCDDGNRDGGDGCGLGCWIEGCGNGFLDENEACEDGNTESGDGCSEDCKSDETCGNGIVDVAAGEICDDGDTDDTDTCPASCEPARCGDGFVQRGVESCDDGNTTPDDGCTDCILDSCSNGTKDPGEECDDGAANGADGSSCFRTCLTTEIGVEQAFSGVVDPVISNVSNPQWIELADFNGDDRLDAAISSADSIRTAVSYGLGDGRFATHHYLTATSSSDGAVFVDLNGDGRRDFAMVSDSSNTVEVVLDDGAGNYIDGGAFSTVVDVGGTGPFGIAAADLTGDGEIDLVTANISTNDVTLMQGAGDGTFTAIAQFGIQSGNGGSRPETIAVGDVTGDGQLDIVTANRTSSDVGVLAGLGNGTFAPVEIYSTVAGATGTGPFDLVLADVTNDGRLDVLTANATSSDVAVLAQNSSGTLNAPLAFPTFDDEIGIGPRSLAVADVNKDGVPDIVTANTNSHDVSVIPGLGAGVAFGPPEIHNIQVDEDAPSPLEVKLADLDDDNNLDIVVGNSDGTIRVLEGDGDGGFALLGASAVTRATSNIGVVDLAVADVDGDGHLDVMISGTSDAIVMSGTGDGRLLPPAQMTGGGIGAAIGEMNGDGRPDVLGPQATTVFTRSLQLHPGSFQSTNVTVTTAATTVGLGDFDGQNGDDAICISAATMFVFQNDGAGNFIAANPASVPLPTTGRGVAIGDVTGDGDLDVVVTLAASNQVGLMVGNGALGFTNPAPLSTADGAGGRSPVFITFADVDGQMGPDIITANQASNDVSVLLSTGSGTFAGAKAVPAVLGGEPATVNMVRTGDFNGDGLVDIATANLARNTVSIIIGFGNGNFAAAQTFNVVAGPTGLAVGDLDGDALDDIAVIGSTGSELQILLSGGHP